MNRTVQLSSIHVGLKLGSGGEGDVYKTEYPPGRSCAFKRYHAAILAKPDVGDKWARLTYMVDNPPSSFGQGRTENLAWPTDLVKDGSRLVGFLMPLIPPDTRSLVVLHNAHDRHSENIRWGWGEMLTIGANLATAVDSLHSQNVYWGDLNETNALVTPAGFVILCDLDTSAVEVGNRYYKGSGVARREWRAPELTHGSFARFSKEADRWALAVELYHLLMDGAWPFAFQWNGQSHAPDVEERIRNGQAPILDSTLELPLASPPLDLLPPILTSMFRRCFGRGRKETSARPSAQQWALELRAVRQRLKLCSRFPKEHVFPQTCSECPWCVKLSRTAVSPTVRLGTVSQAAAPVASVAPPAPTPASNVTPAVLRRRPERRLASTPTSVFSAVSALPTPLSPRSSLPSGSPERAIASAKRAAKLAIGGLAVSPALAVGSAATTYSYDWAASRRLTWPNSALVWAVWRSMLPFLAASAGFAVAGSGIVNRLWAVERVQKLSFTLLALLGSAALLFGMSSASTATRTPRPLAWMLVPIVFTAVALLRWIPAIARMSMTKAAAVIIGGGAVIASSSLALANNNPQASLSVLDQSSVGLAPPSTPQRVLWPTLAHDPSPVLAEVFAGAGKNPAWLSCGGGWCIAGDGSAVQIYEAATGAWAGQVSAAVNPVQMLLDRGFRADAIRALLKGAPSNTRWPFGSADANGQVNDYLVQNNLVAPAWLKCTDLWCIAGLNSEILVFNLRLFAVIRGGKSDMDPLQTLLSLGVPESDATKLIGGGS